MLLSYLRDTSHFLIEIDKLGSVPLGSTLVVADDTRIYTNIIILEALLCIRTILSRYHRILSQRKNSSILDLVELGLNCNNFQFSEENFLQVGGTANIFMAEFEEKIYFFI